MVTSAAVVATWVKSVPSSDRSTAYPVSPSPSAHVRFTPVPVPRLVVSPAGAAKAGLIVGAALTPPALATLSNVAVDVAPALAE